MRGKPLVLRKWLEAGAEAAEAEVNDQESSSVRSGDEGHDSEPPASRPESHAGQRVPLDGGGPEQ